VSAESVRDGTMRLQHGSTKSGRGRSIPLTPRAVVALDALIASPLHGNITVDWCGHRWGHLRRTCGLRDVNLHVLRHTCASRLVQAGVDLYTVAAWLGHSSVKVTERYAHLQPDALRTALQALLGPIK
jgi:integrase